VLHIALWLFGEKHNHLFFLLESRSLQASPQLPGVCPMLLVGVGVWLGVSSSAGLVLLGALPW